MSYGCTITHPRSAQKCCSFRMTSWKYTARHPSKGGVPNQAAPAVVTKRLAGLDVPALSELVTFVDGIEVARVAAGVMAPRYWRLGVVAVQVELASGQLSARLRA